MGIRALIIALLFTVNLVASPQQVLFLMQAGKVHDAIKLYRQEHSDEHDHELLEQIGLTILDRGFRSGDTQSQLITLLGAGISANERTSYILESFANGNDPQLQAMSLQFLARYQNAESAFALTRAMRSEYLLIRLEAAHLMAETKHPKAVGQIDALMHKVDPQLHPLFPQLFALEGSPNSIRILQRLLGHPKEEVRIASILSAAELGRDDLAPQIRKMASHHSLGQQEAAAYALGILGDEEAKAQLYRLSTSKTSSVKIAALQALYRLGDREVGATLIEEAKKENLLAIIALGTVSGSEDTLASLLNHPALIIRMHAALALLDRKDARCVPYLNDILFSDSRDLFFTRGSSLGRAFSAWKVTHGGSHQYQSNPVAYELSLAMREAALTKAMELDEKHFLTLAERIFSQQQNDLVPTLTHHLENIQSPNVIALLRKHQQQAGAPLVRRYCALALYRLHEEGPYASLLSQWAAKEQAREMIELRPFIPWEMREVGSKYEMTPRETSRLLIETFESFAAAQDEQAISVLLEAIQHGHEKNQYALAGLLIRTVQ